jgi:molybdopterin/thiamine biosynthesis adenylyltransferase/ribosomal protein S27E
MTTCSPETIRLTDERFARLRAIEWWDQEKVKNARVLVVGAGALGNEVIKNLALLGVGNFVVVDMDRIEASNLSRSVLFRESDEGQFKASAAAKAAREIYGGVNAHAIDGNLLADVGLGWFRWAQVVIGALDNREARVFVNSSCARVGRAWIDGGIDVLSGIVRGFAPPDTACYECTMSKVDWDLLNKRRSCSLLARRAIAQRGTPTTPTTASIIGACQVQEVIKIIHGMESLVGRGFVFEGLAHSSYPVTYQKNPDCPWHDPASQIVSTDLTSDSTVAELWKETQKLLSSVDAIDLAREIVERLDCPSCGRKQTILQAAEKLTDDQIKCASCGSECSPVFLHAITSEAGLMEKTIRQIGLPEFEIVWARRGEQIIGLEISGDNRHGK